MTKYYVTRTRSHDTIKEVRLWIELAYIGAPKDVKDCLDKAMNVLTTEVIPRAGEPD